MWDVKYNNIINYSQAKLFYLNYVGCKVLKLNNKRQHLNKFYLNYVGCKGLRLDSESFF